MIYEGEETINSISTYTLEELKLKNNENNNILNGNISTFMFNTWMC